MTATDKVYVDIITNTAQSMKSLGEYITKIAATYLSVQALIKLAKSSIEAFKEQDLAVSRLSASFKISGFDMSFAVNNLKELASELQTVTMYGDETTISAMALLRSVGKLNEEGIAKLMPLVQDFATMMTIDLESATMAVAKTLDSDTNALSRYGIQVDMTKNKTEKFSQIMKQLVENEGIAKAAGDTLYGNLVKMGNAFGEIAEESGRGLLFFLRDAIRFYGELATSIANATKKQNDYNEAAARKEQHRETITDELLLVRKERDKLQEQYNRNLIPPTDYYAGSILFSGKARTADDVRGWRETEMAKKYMEDMKAEINALDKTIAYLIVGQNELASAASDAEKKLEAERTAAENLVIYLKEVKEVFAKTPEGEVAFLDEEIQKWETLLQTARFTAPQVTAYLKYLRLEKSKMTPLERQEPNVPGPHPIGMEPTGYYTPGKYGLGKEYEQALALKKIIDTLDTDMTNLAMQMASSGIIDAGYAIGRAMMMGAAGADEMAVAFGNLGASIMKNISALLAQAGFAMIASGPAGWGPGAALLTAAGVTAVIGGAMSTAGQSKTVNVTVNAIEKGPWTAQDLAIEVNREWENAAR